MRGTLLNIVLLFLGLGLEPLVEPLEELTVPHHGILRLKNPVVLIGEYEHTSRDTAQACGIERHHSLRCKNAIVFLTHSDHDRSIPLVDEAVWRIGIAALCNGVFLIPGSQFANHISSVSRYWASTLKIPA